MKSNLFVLFIVLLFFSCTKQAKDFDSFEYSFAGTFTSVFTIKFTDNDTIFLREHWNRESIENNYPKAKTNYFAILSSKQKSELHKIIKKHS